MIKVLVADDSPLTRVVLRDIFRMAGDITVVGEAGDGSEAVSMTGLLKPDLIVMDLLMPVMDGLEAIEEIMANSPTPILVLSATVDEREINQAFSAIKKGALDVMEKPAGTGSDKNVEFAQRLVDKVRLLARIRVIRHPRRRLREEVAPSISYRNGERNILAIGASTGGPKAVMSIMKSLPAEFNAATFIVQHIAEGFTRGFSQWLDQESGIRVRLAAEGDEAVNGVALVAPDDCHMIFEQGKIRLVRSEPVNCCRPSIDVFFNSLATEFGDRVVGVLLTGMGKDGAQGLLRIKERGGVTLVQDEQSCSVFGMPKAAISLAAVDEVLPLADIPAAIRRIFT
jgi:two-component system chemotaxis response regulator CheB